MEEKLTKAKYLEWQASLFGACFVAFGLGAFLSNYLKAWIAPLIIIGVVIHGWGMYRIHKRNK